MHTISFARQTFTEDRRGRKLAVPDKGVIVTIDTDESSLSFRMPGMVVDQLMAHLTSATGLDGLPTLTFADVSDFGRPIAQGAL